MKTRWIAAGMITAVSSVLAAGLLSGREQDLRPGAEIHAIHLEQELECETCHGGADQSSHGTNELRPDMALCGECHDVEAESECGTCHRSAEPAGYPEQRPRVQRFPHDLHLEEGLTCDHCHGAPDNPAIPEMDLCRSCHTTVSGLSDCGVCHAPSEKIIPSSHGPQWRELHPVEGGWDQGQCAVCHTQSDCQDCHAGDNVRPRSHALDFAFDHALAARSGQTDCMACHEDTDFCSSCHVAERVFPQNHSRADWLSSQSGGRHAEEARFDIESCVGCHDQGTEAPVCAECHGR